MGTSQVDTSTRGPAQLRTGQQDVHNTILPEAVQVIFDTAHVKYHVVIMFTALWHISSGIGDKV